jgi:hypothetical protein
MPNSFFCAYEEVVGVHYQKARMTDMKTETPFMRRGYGCIMDRADWDMCIMAFWASMELKI